MSQYQSGFYNQGGSNYQNPGASNYQNVGGSNYYTGGGSSTYQAGGASKYQVRDPYQQQQQQAGAQQQQQQQGFQVNFSDSEADDHEDNIYRNTMNINKTNSNQRNTNQNNQNQQSSSAKKYDNIYVDSRQEELYRNRDIDKGEEGDEFFKAETKPYTGPNDFNMNFTKGATLYSSKDQVQDKPIQLIAFDPSQDKFLLNQEALSILKLYDEPISFVAVAGKYRTGKSFILNKLMNIKGRGFKVDASTQSCTQGIWMWSKPVQGDNKQIFFIDTEGTTSIEGNKKHDAKIFSLALLISSLFIFNSVGAIDDKSIQELQLTTQISRNIQVSNNVSQNDQLISQYTPKFIWLLRDFVLEIVDNNGQPLNPNQYLNNCLNDQTSAMKQSQISRKVREALLQYFRQRECFTMVRPVTSEEELKTLDSLPIDRLRPQFLRELNSLRSKIFQMVEPKMMEGMILKPSIFAELIKKYVDQINEKNGVPDIKSAWDNIMEGESQVSYEKAMQVYQEMKIKFFSSGNTLTQKEVEQNKKKLRQQAMKIFEEGTTIKEKNLYYDNYKQKLTQFIDNFESQLEHENNAFSDTGNQELLVEMQNDLNNQHFSIENIQEFHDKIREWIIRYNDEGKGSNKMEILTQYFPDILQTQLNRIVEGSNQTEQIEELQSQIATLKQQLLDSKKNAELSKNTAVAEYKKQVENLKAQITNLEQTQSDHKTVTDQLKKKANAAIDEKEKLEQQLLAKDSELMKIQVQLKEAQLAAKKKKSKCGCF